MKRILSTILLLATTARAEEAAKDDLTELYSKLGAVSPKVVKAGFTILHVEFDRLAPGGEYSLRRDLSAKNGWRGRQRYFRSASTLDRR